MANEILVMVIGIFLGSTGLIYLADVKKKGKLNQRDKAVSFVLIGLGLVVILIPGITLLSGHKPSLDTTEERKSRLMGEDAFQTDVKQMTASYEEASLLYAKGASLWNAERSSYDSTSRVMDYFNRSVEKYETAEALVGRGQLKVQLGKMNEAMEDYNRAIQIKPEFGNAYFNRAALNYIYGDLQKACDDWRRASKLGVEQATTVVSELCN